MNGGELAGRIERMPKVELHVHVEGATDPETVWEMAGRNNVRLPASSLAEWRRYYQYRDFNHFIDVYKLAVSTMRTLADWPFMIERFVANQARQNVRYTEAFLSASLQLGKFPADEWLAAILEGAAAGERKHGVRVRFIPDIARELPETRHRVLDFIVRGQRTGMVVGIGLGGIEAGHPPEWFTDVYQEARRHGLRLHAHAGETVGPASIRGAISSLHVERIGHGVRCLEDARLVDELRRSKLPLEVAPTSNYCCGVVRRGAPHPIRRMVDAGLTCTVNSDDPPMFGTDLTGEYRLLAGQGFTWAELWRLSLNAVEAAFLSDEQKAVLRHEWANFAASLK